jgi:hypothetical protein
MHDAVDGQAVPRLEAADRFLEIGVVDIVLDRARIRIEVARYCQTRTQLGHA